MTTPTKQAFLDAIENLQRLADLIEREPVIVPPLDPPPPDPIVFDSLRAITWPELNPPVVIPPDLPGLDADWYLNQQQGTIKTIFIDTIKDHDPSKEWLQAYPGKDWPWRGVSGIASAIENSAMAYCPHYGKLGAYATRGGGHGGYGGTETYLQILAARKVARLDYPSNRLFTGSYTSGDSSTYWRGYPWHKDTGERWAGPFLTTDTLATKPTIPNTTASGHTYCYVLHLDPGMGHDDPQGAILTTGVPAMYRGGSQNTRVASIMLLSKPELGHQRFSTNMMAVQTGFSGALLDRKRRRVVVHDFNGGFQILDLTTKVYTPAPNLSPAMSRGYHGWLTHLEDQDVYVYVVIGGQAPVTQPNGHISVYVIDPVTWKVTKPAVPLVPNFQVLQGTTLVPTIGGSCYNEDIDALVYHPGYGNTLYQMMLGDIRKDAITCVPKAFTGDAGFLQYSPQQAFHEHRIDYNKQLGGYFWLAGVDKPMQFWRE